ncbi:hypothetical protein CWE12_00680 [Aliidiomarina sedimenti]|uniref:HTH luxR-type domain-containing protein n=2 Tax=Aliidiomarina TaxID=1249554 RepID=A0A432WHL6_9GAMM|nr:MULTISPECIES: response regulator transcription factor [Aliidiomarina]RUO31551.1 hypothetical protein CWE12_00680 [Aliidiomarina sedimenti]RUO33312.1 hypothetical protein CWE14_08820 [Aliidiomarina soli]
MRQLIIAVSGDVCRAGLQATFEHEHWRCTANVQNRHQLLHELRGPAERIVILDSNFCAQGSKSLIRAIKRQAPLTRIIFWCFKVGSAIDHYIADEEIDAYMYQYTEAEEWLKACMQVHLGYKYFTPYLTGIFRRIKQNGDEQPLLSGLSKRERLVLQLLCSGDTVNDIASRLFISRKTVNTFRYRLFKKTNTQSDVQLVHLAISTGLVPLTPNPYEHGRLPVRE